MSDAISNAVELLLERQRQLETQREDTKTALRDIESELARIEAGIRTLRGGRKTNDGNVKTTSTRNGSVKDLVVQQLRGSTGLTPAEVYDSLVAEGKLVEGRQSSVRTALWQLRKEGAVLTDGQNRTKLTKGSS